ncbi:MAG TPA: cupin domain-containing protein [Thermoanaerobaculia bacterium]|nr:cupin domain-containing protein [Thermoanaerobaculia bacterium]
MTVSCTVILNVEGQPTRTLKAGDVFTIPTGAVHEGMNKSDSTAKLTVVFVAEKGKPLTTKVE